MKTLISKGLAEERIAEGKTPVWRTTDDGRRLAVLITVAGLTAIGMVPPVGKCGRRSRAPGKKASVAAKQGAVTGVSPDETRRPRPGSKLAMLVGLLERDGGATIEEMVTATGWQGHSVRGVMSGMLAKKFAMRITSESIEGRGRVYRTRDR